MFDVWDEKSNFVSKISRSICDKQVKLHSKDIVRQGIPRKPGPKRLQLLVKRQHETGIGVMKSDGWTSTKKLQDQQEEKRSEIEIKQEVMKNVLASTIHDISSTLHPPPS